MDFEADKKILQEIMDLMDEKEGDKLKNHPKILAAQVEVGAGDPKDLLKKKFGSEEGEEESPEEDVDQPSEEQGEGELSPEMIQALLDKLEKE